MAKHPSRAQAAAAQTAALIASASLMYVYSTLSSDVNYVNHTAAGNDMPLALIAPPGPDGVKREGVFVKGGAGVANDRLITPRGVATRVTEEQVEYLRANPVFQLHEENGFVQISTESVDPDKAAADMEGRDASAPLVPQDPGVDGLKVATDS